MRPRQIKAQFNKGSRLVVLLIDADFELFDTPNVNRAAALIPMLSGCVVLNDADEAESLGKQLVDAAKKLRAAQ